MEIICKWSIDSDAAVGLPAYKAKHVELNSSTGVLASVYASVTTKFNKHYDMNKCTHKELEKK